MTAPPGLAPHLAPPDPAGLLRTVFRRHAAGVAVITAQGRLPVGFTATSLTSLAAEPPLVTFSLAATSSSWPALAEAAYVAVHLLAENQAELATRFALSGVDRFGPPTTWRRGPLGVPLLDAVLAWLVCRVVERVPVAGHHIVIAEVITGDLEEAACTTESGRPLLHHLGHFTALAQRE